MSDDITGKTTQTTQTTQQQQSAGAKAAFRIGVFALIERDGAYLMGRRRDIGWWNLPGGGLEYGETLEQGLAREVMEEVGIDVAIERLVGVYSKPQKREVVLTFLCHLSDANAQPGVSDETSEVGWYTADALPEQTLPKHRQRVEDAALGQVAAIVRAQTSTTEEDQGLNKGM
ncbi:MAG: NUDIX domain-containing protein [Ktedonobacterales bacterium]